MSELDLFDDGPPPIEAAPPAADEPPAEAPRMKIIRLPKLREDDQFEEAEEYEVSEWDATKAAAALWMAELQVDDANDRSRKMTVHVDQALTRLNKVREIAAPVLSEYIKANGIGSEVNTTYFGKLRIEAGAHGIEVTPADGEHKLLTFPASATIAEKLRTIINAEDAAATLKRTADMAVALARVAQDNADKLQADAKEELRAYAKAHPVPGKSHCLVNLAEVGMPDVTVQLGWRAGTQYPEVEDEQKLIASFDTEGKDAVIVEYVDGKQTKQAALLTLIPARWSVDKTVLGSYMRRGAQVAGAYLKDAVESFTAKRI